MVTCKKGNRSSLGDFKENFFVGLLCWSARPFLLVLFQYRVMLFLIQFYSFYTVFLTYAALFVCR